MEEKIRRIARRLTQQVDDGSLPTLDVPKRTMSNVKYDPTVGYFHLGGDYKTRRLHYRTSKKFAQTLKLLSLILDTIKEEENLSKREAYYISKNWGDVAFGSQNSSDDILDDLEALLEVNREKMRVTPEEKGGEVAGNLTVLDRDPKSGQQIKIDCTHFGQGAYSIPSRVEDLQFEVEAQFILAIETAGMFQRLNDHGYWNDANCILISMGGVPTRACRRFIRRLSDEHDLPVYAFVDGDPYGYANIYRTLKVGSANAAHINQHFCVPGARFLGVMPRDIERYDLPTHELDERGAKRARDAMENDPFFGAHDSWRMALQRMLDLGVRAEQQAFAKHGLNMVMETYLPEKTGRPETFFA